MKSKLNEKQLERLAGSLVGTTRNVFSMAEALFQVDVGEEIFHDLEDVEGIFHCENCDEWKDSDEKSRHLKDWCQDCSDAIDDDMEGDSD